MTTVAAQLDSREAVGGGWRAVRSRAAHLLRKHSWIPSTATLLSGACLVAALAASLNLAYELAAGSSLATAAFIWGYWQQAQRRRLFPPLAHLHRRQYAATWDELASSREEACAAAAGRKRDEQEFRDSASGTIRNLLELVQVRPSDEVLEVGCGVGRIGEALARSCSGWTGADMSINMLGYASERLRGSSNVRLVRLRRVGLFEFDNRSFDLVYFTNMLMHLDEMDRWHYAKEAFRVLRPEGRVFMDVIDIESEPGWSMFVHDADRYRHLERPPYMPRFSSATELATYLRRAGFGAIQIHRRSPLVIVTGIKPGR